MSEYLKVADMARELGVSKSTMHRVLASRKLPHVRIGNTFLVHRREWAKFLRLREAEGLMTPADWVEIFRPFRE